jgi:hypothetical protein
MALGKIDVPFFGVPRKEKREKRRKRTPFFAVGGFVGVCLSAGRARPVDHLGLPHVLGQPPPAQCIHSLFDGGPPPGVCAWSGWGHGAFHHLRGAYLGEQPTPRKVEGEAEKPHASVPAEVFGGCLYQPFHKEEGRGVWAGWRRRRVSSLRWSANNRPAEGRGGVCTMRLGGG